MTTESQADYELSMLRKKIEMLRELGVVFYKEDGLVLRFSAPVEKPTGLAKPIQKSDLEIRQEADELLYHSSS